MILTYQGAQKIYKACEDNAIADDVLEKIRNYKNDGHFTIKIPLPVNLTAMPASEGMQYAPFNEITLEKGFDFV